MTSSFKETKIYFEKMFTTDWTLTPVHYAGEEFNSKDIEKWVNIFYEPTYGNHNDLSCNTANYGNLHVASWADYDIDAMELSDIVTSFVNTNIDKTKYRVRRFEVSDHGWNDSNKVFVLLTFSIEMLVA